MADNNRLMSSQEIEDEKRKRQLAIVKASNQMLNEAMEKALDNTSDPVRRSELQERFNVAIEQNDADLIKLPDILPVEKIEVISE